MAEPYDKRLVPGGEWSVCPVTETNIYAPDHRGGTRRVLDVRGWGYLTGQGGGLGLPFDEAIKIQNAIGLFVCEAGTVLSETGMTPRELVDEVERLRAALRPLRVSPQYSTFPDNKWVEVRLGALRAVDSALAPKDTADD